MQYLLPRLEDGVSRARQAGGRAGGATGAWERADQATKIETDRRRIRSQMAKIRRNCAPWTAPEPPNDTLVAVRVFPWSPSPVT